MHYTIQAYFPRGWTYICGFDVLQPLDWTLWLDFLFENLSTPLRFGYYDDHLIFHVVVRSALYRG